MRKLLALFCIGILFTDCNDGDVLEVGLEFDKTLSFCDQSSTNYLVYDIKQDPFESLSLLFPRNADTRLIFAPIENNYLGTFEINGTAVRFNYRTYDGNPENLLCALVPDPNTTIINDYESPSGVVSTKTSFIDDDEDGIPTEFEDPDFFNDPTVTPKDSDGDGIPDYKDADDDNDNILTKFENHNFSVENGLADAVNSDDDTFPNGQPKPDYLDNDDDGDGTLTRYEDEDLDLDPRNDYVTSPASPRYLDPLATESYQTAIDLLEVSFVPNKFKRSYTVKFKLNLIDIQILSTDEIDFGTYKYSATIVQ